MNTYKIIICVCTYNTNCKFGRSQRKGKNNSDDVSNVKNYATNEKMNEWRQNNKPPQYRWVEIFKYYISQRRFKNR